MASAGVTVAMAPLRHEAELQRLVLRAAGIGAWLVDDGIVAANPLLANAVGWIKVNVDPADEPRARALLAEVQKAATPGDACLSCGTPMRDDESACSRCGWSFGDDLKN